MKNKVVIFVVLALMSPVLAGPDGQYCLVFITSEVHDAVSSDIEVYNDWVQGLANAAGIGNTSALLPGGVEWKAIGSTATVDARDNTGTNPLVDGVGVPVYLLDGTTLIANDNADLWDGQIANGIDQYQAENTSTVHTWVFTGTKNDGTKADGVNMWSHLGNEDGTKAVQGSPNPAMWITGNTGWAGAPLTDEIRFYAISEVIPEPATMALLGLGGLTLLRRRRNV